MPKNRLTSYHVIVPSSCRFMIISGNESRCCRQKGPSLGAMIQDIPYSPTEIYARIRTTILDGWCRELKLKTNTFCRKTVRPGRPMGYLTNYKMDKSITRLRLGANLLPTSSGWYILWVDQVCI
jgi:hypothetical protein